jgi:hypothetical protein
MKKWTVMGHPMAGFGIEEIEPGSYAKAKQRRRTALESFFSNLLRLLHPQQLHPQPQLQHSPSATYFWTFLRYPSSQLELE